MTPAQRAEIRAGRNLAEMPAEVNQTLISELRATGERFNVVRAHALRLFTDRPSRIKAEIELKGLGELEKPVRERLNRLMAEGRG